MSAELRASYDELRTGMKFDLVARGNVLLRLPTDAERQQLTHRLVDLNIAMRPISYTAHGPQMGLAGAAIAEMFQGFIGFKPDPKVKEQSIGWYVHELKGMPLFAIEMACADVRAGRVPDLKPDFPPTSARMVQLARGHQERVSAEQSAVKAILGAKITAAEVEIDDATAERIRSGLEEIAHNIRTEDARQAKEESDRREAKAKANNERGILQEYARRGQAPVYGPGGTLISPILRDKIEEWKREPAPKPRDDHKDQGS